MREELVADEAAIRIVEGTAGVSADAMRAG